MEKGSHDTRSQQIIKDYSNAIDQHLYELLSGKAEKMFEIEDFAALLCIHPTHLSNTIKEVSGLSACGVYQIKIIESAHQLLDDHKKPIQEIAAILNFEPSQFTKWFKRFHRITPKAYRAGMPFKIQY